MHEAKENKSVILDHFPKTKQKQVAKYNTCVSCVLLGSPDLLLGNLTTFEVVFMQRYRKFWSVHKYFKHCCIWQMEVISPIRIGIWWLQVHSDRWTPHLSSLLFHGHCQTTDNLCGSTWRAIAFPRWASRDCSHKKYFTKRERAYIDWCLIVWCIYIFI